MGKIHPTIINFAEQMQQELEDNSHKGDFFDWTDEEHILNELEYHKAKLLIALRKNPEKVKEYIADCGNILMALGNSRKLFNQ